MNRRVELCRGCGNRLDPGLIAGQWEMHPECYWEGDARALGQALVMTDLDGDDPRLDPLVAQARRERCMIVTAWEETEDGQLIDTSSEAYRRAQAHDPAG